MANASRYGIFPNYEALRTLRGVLRRGESSKFKHGIGPHLLAKAMVEIQMITFTNASDSGRFNRPPFRSINVIPDQDGGVSFDQLVEWHFSPTVSFKVSPEDFGLANPEEHLRFDVYRAFIFIVCGVPLLPDAVREHLTKEGFFVWGPFRIACRMGTDDVAWEKVRLRWEGVKPRLNRQKKKK